MNFPAETKASGCKRYMLTMRHDIDSIFVERCSSELCCSMWFRSIVNVYVPFERNQFNLNYFELLWANNNAQMPILVGSTPSSTRGHRRYKLSHGEINTVKSVNFAGGTVSALCQCYQRPLNWLKFTLLFLGTNCELAQWDFGSPAKPRAQDWKSSCNELVVRYWWW